MISSQVNEMKHNQILIIGNIQNCFTKLVCSLLYHGYEIVYTDTPFLPDIFSYMTKSSLIISSTKKITNNLTQCLNEKQCEQIPVPIILCRANQITNLFNEIIKTNQMLYPLDKYNLQKISAEMKKFSNDQGRRVLIYDRYFFKKSNGYITYKILKTENRQEEVRIKRAIVYIDNHFNHHITLDEISKIANLSPYYFCRQFKTQTGMTFKNYLTFIRILYAKKLITETHQSITEISFASGYEELGSFERAFKKHEGISPIQYRFYHSKKAINADKKSIFSEHFPSFIK